jgi:uncharacterized protein (DUF427 family)
MLWSVRKRFQDGTVTDEIISSPSPYVVNITNEKIVASMTKIHKYNYEHIYPPMFYKSHTDGKLYLMPVGIEVHPETTMDDVIWTKPKLKKEIEHIQGSVGIYKTTYDPNKKTYKCTCMGFWRSKGNCKHIKALKEKNK